MSRPASSLLAFAIATACTTAHAATAPPDEATQLARVTVVGIGGKVAEQPGSVTVLDAQDLDSTHVLTVNEALRKVPGVHVRDEEGFGLRPNIGIRGLNPTRSTKVLLLEDGIPSAYAPYGDNASYYHAPIERYERIEVLKGTGILRYGPQTIGGVINYITPRPPAAFEGLVELSGGNLGYGKGRLRLGGAGQLFDAMHKRGEGARDNQDLRQTDLNYKYAHDFGGSDLTVRATWLQEDSQLTYSGLTDAEYRNLGARYNPFANDHFDARRYGGSMTWSTALGGADLQVNAYYFQFHRDWWRQASTTTDGQCGGAFTNTRLAGQRVDPDTCNSAQGRLRDYTTWGLEPRLGFDYALGGVPATLEAGLRYHDERQERLQINAASPTGRSGALAESNVRTTGAVSGYLQNRFDFGRLALIPAVRYERIDHGRRNRLTGATGRASVSEWIPGLGLTFDIGEGTTLFAGVHEGYAPPRTEDLISNTGASVDVGAERSRNAELGLRGTPRAGLSYEVALFDNDFDNQIAVGSIAGGSTPLAEGEARYRGAEVSVRADFGTLLGRDHNPYLQMALTALPEAGQTTAFRRVDNGLAVSGSAAGRRMPYAPERTATARLGWQRGAWDMSVEGVYIDSQYADFANTRVAPVNGNGQAGELPGYTTLNLALNYAPMGAAWNAFAAVKNATDRDYIADRTRGILPGAPRQVLVGIAYQF